MSDEPSGPPGKWWVRGESTSRHRYFFPTGSLQGVLLFALIALLGLASLLVGAHHSIVRHDINRRGLVLCLVGFTCLLLGCVQGWKLAREE